ncbi:Uncharacterised protein [uncultured archaeon]|nr:Uncharacterised protein [uncultured archaeon]
MEKSVKNQSCTWVEVRKDRLERKDGAVVEWDDSSPYSFILNPRARFWVAYEPNPSTRAVSMERGKIRKDEKGNPYRLRCPKRWKTAEAAMKAVDKIFPNTAE